MKRDGDCREGEKHDGQFSWSPSQPMGLMSHYRRALQEVRFDAISTPGPVHQPLQLVHVLQLAIFVIIIHYFLSFENSSS